MFDVEKYGLESHYHPNQHEKIRRLILEDWRVSGVKLPTYMKLLARYIASTGVSEDWLSKLRHQTMDTMLKRISVPRYEFWACLHLYLNKKYGNLDISASTDEADTLGQALIQFGDIEEAAKSTKIMLGDTELVLEAQEGKLYLRAQATTTSKGSEPLSVEVERTRQGVAVKQEGRVVAVLRDTATRDISTIEVEAGS